MIYKHDIFEVLRQTGCEYWCHKQWYSLYKHDVSEWFYILIILFKFTKTQNNAFVTQLIVMTLPAKIFCWTYQDRALLRWYPMCCRSNPVKIVISLVMRQTSGNNGTSLQVIKTPTIGHASRWLVITFTWTRVRITHLWINGISNTVISSMERPITIPVSATQRSTTGDRTLRPFGPGLPFTIN